MNVNIERFHFQDLSRFFRKRAWVVGAVAGIVTLTAAAISLREPKVYQAEARISIQPESSTMKMLPRQLVSYEAYYLTNMKFDTEMEILRSKPMAERVTRAIGVTPETDGPAAFAARTVRVQGCMDIRRLENTRIIRLICQDTDAEMAQRIVNTFAEQYISKTVEDQVESFTKSHTWLKEQIVELEQRVQESEQAVIDYVKANGIDFMDITPEPSSSSPGEFDAAVRPPASVTTEAGVLDTLRTQLIAREAEKTELSSRYKPAHPRMRGLDEQIASLRQRIAQQEGALKQTKKASREQTLQIREKAIQYDLLRRAADTNKALYNALIQKFKEIDITGNIGETDIRVVEKAERPDRPIRPNPQRTISLAALIGLALGVLAALLMEIMDPRIKSIEEFKEIFEIPILGTVPLIGGEQDDESNSADTPAAQVSRLRPASIPAEAYRTLRTNVKFSHPVETGRSLLVTSSSPREGKTTTSINLAVTTALAGKRVLLIDADLRNPTVHREMNLSSSIGFTHYLAGDITDWHEAISPTWNEKLDVLTCGVIPPNPSELLESARLRQFMKEAVSEYDQVIVDASPLLPVADASILATVTQGVLLVLDSGNMNRSEVGRTVEQIRKTGAKIYGVVMNKFTDLKHAHYYYYYSYPAPARPK